MMENHNPGKKATLDCRKDTASIYASTSLGMNDFARHEKMTARNQHFDTTKELQIHKLEIKARLIPL
ncbi:MAG: hypothetical protein AAF798_13165 [Bacteroidota bacterium]